MLSSLKKKLKTFHPGQILRKSAFWMRYGGFRFYCPVCGGHFRTFLPFGLIPRPQARCPACGSLERHRLVILFLRRQTNLFKGRPLRLLHAAPEEGFTKIFENLRHLDYVSADLNSPRARVKMDFTAIPEPDNSYDAVLCLHVLEHIPEDGKAIRECYRILKPGGWALIQVPLKGEKTYEDWSIQDEAGRTAAFGQGDHVRQCGRDYRERLEAAGFRVSEHDAGSLTARERQRLSIRSEPFYFCVKPGRG